VVIKGGPGKKKKGGNLQPGRRGELVLYNAQEKKKDEKIDIYLPKRGSRRGLSSWKKRVPPGRGEEKEREKKRRIPFRGKGGEGNRF